MACARVEPWDPTPADPTVDGLAQRLMEEILGTEGEVTVAHGTALPIARAAAARTPVAGLVLTNGPVEELDPATRTLARLARSPRALAATLLQPAAWTRWLASSAGCAGTVVNPYVMDRDTVVARPPYTASAAHRESAARFLRDSAALRSRMRLRRTGPRCGGDEDPLYPASLRRGPRRDSRHRGNRSPADSTSIRSSDPGTSPTSLPSGWAWNVPRRLHRPNCDMDVVIWGYRQYSAYRAKTRATSPTIIPKQSTLARFVLSCRPEIGDARRSGGRTPSDSLAVGAPGSRGTGRLYFGHRSPSRSPHGIWYQSPMDLRPLTDTGVAWSQADLDLDAAARPVAPSHPRVARRRGSTPPGTDHMAAQPR